MTQPPRPRVWITRAEPGATRTAERVASLGLEPVKAPVLRIEPVEAQLDLNGVAGLAFTSANGVRAFAGRSAMRDRPVFAVGDRTAQVARSAGFTDVRSASGALADLAALIPAEAPGPILHPCAREPAGDLAALLGDGRVRSVAVYRAVETGATAPQDIDAVLIHSPRAARVVASRGAPSLADPVRIIAISPAAAPPLIERGLAVVIAASPDEDALLAALTAALGKPRRPV